MAGNGNNPEALVPLFKLDRVLNQDQGGLRVSLVGTINGLLTLMLVERAPFPADEKYLASIPASLTAVKNLGANDIYSWFMANSGGNGSNHHLADLKINLIHPCTEVHIKKYSKQGMRFVVETPDIYASHVRPYMASKREAGRLNWVYNIIDGVKEAEDVIYRTPLGRDGDEGFLLLPDLNWDRKTVEALHLLCLVERRDIWSLRDLKKKHIPWLHHMRTKLLAATCEKYPELQPDQLKLYVHYQPTYYHLHIHIVHVALEAGATQATGKAVGLESIVETLQAMAGGENAGMDRISMSYTVGEAHELWTQVFEPIKNGSKS